MFSLEKHGLIEQQEEFSPKYEKNIGITGDVDNLEKDFSEYKTTGEASNVFSDYDFWCVIL